MALAPSNIQTTTFSGQVVNAYVDGEYFRPDMSVYVSQPQGGKTKRFPVFGSITVATQADGTDLSAGGSFTPTAADVSTFDPTIAYETLLYQTIADFEGYVPSALSRRLGMDLSLRKSNILTNIVAKAANDRAASAGQIEIAGGVGTPTDANFQAAFQTGLLNIRKANINPANAVAILRPEFFYALRNSAVFASSDYIKSGMTDNATMAGTMKYGGVEIICASGSFLGTDKSADTTLPSTARFNGSTAWGVIFAKDSLAVYETEPVHGLIEDVPHRQSWLAVARTIFGAAPLQTSGMFVWINAA